MLSASDKDLSTSDSSEMYLNVFQVVLEWAVDLFALPKLDQCPAHWHPGQVKFVQEAAGVSQSTHALQPVGAYRLHTTYKPIICMFRKDISPYYSHLLQGESAAGVRIWGKGV